jgi:hypothetical protein
MRWSRVKKAFESLLAERLKGRLQVHVTEYSKSAFDIGRGHISVDGHEFVSVQVPSFYDKHFHFETTVMDFGKAVGAYVNLPFQQAVASTDPIVRGLTFLDARFGKRSLQSVDPDALHAFARVTYDLRCRFEGTKPKRASVAATTG